MSVPAKELHAYQARLATFQTPHQLSKRRASSQSKKKSGNTAEWPHERPAPEKLASAGFFYRPSQDSPDNVQCFLCTVKLDGWETTDDPVQEHLAHSRQCAWATIISVDRADGDARGPELRDPLTDEMLDARKATFVTGDGWPHESKKTWKCKINKMIEAGWAWDPACEGEDGDGVTCFYCNLSLDGWEPKDDPFEEHKRRSPDCRFFQLLEHYHGSDAANGKKKKTKARAKKGHRTSTASKSSRLSTQSAMSAAMSIPGSFDGMSEDTTMAGGDDSVLTTASDVSRVTTTSTGKGKKKGTKSKAVARGAKGSKRASSGSKNNGDMASQHPIDSETQEKSKETSSTALSKASKRGTRASKQLDSSVIEISQLETAPAKRSTRGQTTKDEIEVSMQPLLPETPDSAAIAHQRLSEVSAQLQEELEHSVDHFEPLDESTPVAQPVKAKRGVKRTSEGQEKPMEVPIGAVEADHAAHHDSKGKRGRPKKASAGSTSVQSAESASIARGVVAPASKSSKAKPKRKEASQNTSQHSSRSSKAKASTSQTNDTDEDELILDDMEVEQELEHMASEQTSPHAMQSSQNPTGNLDSSPFQDRTWQDDAELIRQLQEEVDAEDRHVSEKDFASPQRLSKIPGSFTPSPSGSDKENQPSSAVRTAEKRPQSPIAHNAVKTIHVPLAATTPNRSSARHLQSPSKHVSHLTSTVPWQALDLDTVLLASPQPSPGKVGQQLVAAAGTLTSPEKRMSVEEWVRHQAEKGEEELRKRCERMVAAFEKEGMKGLESLNGINVHG